MLSKEKRALIAEVLRRGGALLAEPCPKCGGLLIKYKGRVFCPNCDNINTIEELESRIEMKPAGLQDIDDLIMQRLTKVLKEEQDDAKASSIAVNYLNALKILKELKVKNES